MPLLQTDTAEGAAKGMVLARAPHQLQDQEVAYLQDAIISQAGFVNRRGAITGTFPLTGSVLDDERPMAMGTVYDPAGVQKIIIFYGKSTGATIELWAGVFQPDLTFLNKHYIVGTGLFPQRGVSVHAVPAIDGSLLISMRYSFSRAPGLGTPLAMVMKWYGGNPTTGYTAGASPTIPITTTEGSRTVTGIAADINKVAFPGMILKGVGVVATVGGAGTVFLMYPATRTLAAVATEFYIVENLTVFRARGRVACTAGVLTGVTGYGTKFTESKDTAGSAAGAGTGFTYLDSATMLKLADLTSNAVIPAPTDTLSGVPTAVTRSASLKNYILYANETLVDSHYNRHAGMPSTSNTPPQRAAKGSWFATYKGYMISFNAVVSATSAAGGDLAVQSRAYIHGPRFPEIMDHSSSDGDWFEVASTKGGDTYGTAIMAGTDAVVLCKAQETFALTGDNPDNFTLNKIADDGALSYDGVASWRGAPIWVGRTGIWMYSAGMSEPENLLENNLGPRWKDFTAAFDTDSAAVDSDNHRINQVHCFVHKDYLFVNVMNTGSAYSVITDGVARTQNPMQLMIYMPTRAVTFLTNFNFQAYVQVGAIGYALLSQLGNTVHHMFPVDNLFTQGLATVDSILTCNSYNSGSVSTSVGPWFHMEARRSAIGDGLLKKNWKQLAIESKLTSTKRMFLETVAGLNTTGVRATLPFTGTGAYLAQRVKFRTRDQYMGFRLYEDISNRPATLSLGAWQWAFKPARRGAV